MLVVQNIGYSPVQQHPLNVLKVNITSLISPMRWWIILYEVVYLMPCLQRSDNHGTTMT